MLQSMGWQRVRHNLVTEQQQDKEPASRSLKSNSCLKESQFSGETGSTNWNVVGCGFCSGERAITV